MVNQLAGVQVPPFHFGIGITILVDWAETNRRHHIVIVLEHEHGGEPLMRFEAELETGRPPGAVEGSDQRVVMAFSQARSSFPRPAATVPWRSWGTRSRSTPASG